MFTYVTLDHKTSLKSLSIFVAIAKKNIEWIKFIIIYFMAKIIRILIKDYVPWRYFVNVYCKYIKT